MHGFVLGIASISGYELKQAIIQTLTDIEFIDLGTNDSDRVDYPHFADRLCTHIIEQNVSCGILICGTGIGISIRANRHFGIRAAVVTSKVTAGLAKAHNNANVICLGGRTTSNEDAIIYINEWLSSTYEGGRHDARLAMLDQPI